MSIDVYYFSGTGNSLAAAREIAENMNGTLKSIPSVIGEPVIRTQAETIGIVFPSYMAHLYGVPLMVERFVKKLDGLASRRIFAVCTCGAYECVNALPTLKNFERLVRAEGGRLTAGFSVRFPMNNLDYDHMPVPIERDNGIILKKAGKKIGDICDRLVRGKREKFGIAKSLFNLLMTPMYLAIRKVCIRDLIIKSKEPENAKPAFRDLMPLTDRSISIDETCTGCGTCVKICPAGNIVLSGKKPEWLHRCEMCFACDEWCPSNAVHHWGRAAGVKYRHPEVNVSDMAGQAAAFRTGGHPGE